MIDLKRESDDQSELSQRKEHPQLINTIENIPIRKMRTKNLLSDRTLYDQSTLRSNSERSETRPKRYPQMFSKAVYTKYSLFSKQFQYIVHAKLGYVLQNLGFHALRIVNRQHVTVCIHQTEAICKFL